MKFLKIVSILSMVLFNMYSLTGQPFICNGISTYCDPNPPFGSNFLKKISCEDAGNYACWNYVRWRAEVSPFTYIPYSSSVEICSLNGDISNLNSYIPVCQSYANIAVWSGNHAAYLDGQGSSYCKSKLNNKYGIYQHTVNDYTSTGVSFSYYMNYVGSLQCPMLSSLPNIDNQTLTGLLNTQINFILSNSLQSGVSYSWKVNGTLLGTSNNLSFTFTNPGTYVVSVSVTGNCPVQTRTQSVTIIFPQITGTFQDSNGSHNLNTYNSTKTGSVTTNLNCPNATSIIWTKTSGSNISWYSYNSGLYMNITMPSGGNISFNAKAYQNSILLDSKNYTFQNSGSFLRIPSNNFLYPNPANTYVNVNIPINEEHKIEIINVLGQVVITAYVNTQKTIFLNKVDNGLYLIRVLKGTELVLQEKLLVQK